MKPFTEEQLKKYDENELERLAIMTVDGNVPDAMAEKFIDSERKSKCKSEYLAIP